jgi:hypothetical protein
MRSIRADPFAVLLTATVALFMAALTWQSSPLHLVASVLVAVVVVALARRALGEIRAWGARPMAVAGVVALAGLALAAQVVPLVVDLGWLRVVLIVVAWGGLLLAMIEPGAFVRVMGGPRVEWELLRDRAALWRDVRGLSDEQLAAAQPTIGARVQALDRYRAPTTEAYIDAFQRLILGDDPPEIQQRLAARMSQLEAELLRTLGPRPAWDDEAVGSPPVPDA